MIIYKRFSDSQFTESRKPVYFLCLSRSKRENLDGLIVALIACLIP